MPEISQKHKNAYPTVWGNPRLGEVLITRTQIADRVRELADQIVGRYSLRDSESFELVIVAIMTGSMIFLADLVRALPLPLRIAIMMVSF